MLTSWLAALLLCDMAVPAGAAAIEDRFVLGSSDIESNGRIGDTFVFNSFGCSGGNISPALRWSGAPRGTKSFVLTVYDPDAPTGSGFWHWVMYNIPANVTRLPQGAGTPGREPAGAVQGNSDYGAPGYGGPCPPAGLGSHRYVFTIYAVKAEKLEVPPNPTAAVVGFATHFVTIGKATLVATYGR